VLIIREPILSTMEWKREKQSKTESSKGLNTAARGVGERGGCTHYRRNIGMQILRKEGDEIISWKKWASGGREAALELGCAEKECF